MLHSSRMCYGAFWNAPENCLGRWKKEAFSSVFYPPWVKSQSSHTLGRCMFKAKRSPEGVPAVVYGRFWGRKWDLGTQAQSKARPGPRQFAEVQKKKSNTGARRLGTTLLGWCLWQAHSAAWSCHGPSCRRDKVPFLDHEWGREQMIFIQGANSSLLLMFAMGFAQWCCDWLVMSAVSMGWEVMTTMMSIYNAFCWTI